MPMVIDYKAVLHETMRSMVANRKKIEQLEIESAKLRQFFSATVKMLPDEEREEFIAAMREVIESVTIRESSLKDAIYRVLTQVSPKFLTATEVRDQLRASGFDFSEYTSNELASISTTLRRFKPDEVETSTNDTGVAEFRWNQQRANAEALRQKNMIPLSDLARARGIKAEAPRQKNTMRISDLRRAGDTNSSKQGKNAPKLT